MRRSIISQLLLALTFLSPIISSNAAVLVTTNTTWRLFKGTNEASTPTSAWRNRSFSSTTWALLASPFYYGENLSGGTALSDMRGNYSSIYLRKEFILTNAASITALDLNAMSDDGFIAWINGVEVRRYNVGEGEIPFNGVASNAPEPPAFILQSLPNPQGYLTNGVNVLAIQAFNTSLDASSDFVFNAELRTVDPDLQPPTIVSVDPAPGTVKDFTQFKVTFSEPVAGVDAIDLLVNTIPAKQVIASGNSYTFTFDRPNFGNVDVRWGSSHQIVDLGRPANPFNGDAFRWEYTLIDNEAPALTSVEPVRGSTVRKLTDVEIVFSEPVEGLDAADLLVNGRPAASVTGFGSGPYRFQFASPESGTVTVSWAANHQIKDLSETGITFAASSWTYTLNPSAVPGDIIINEFLAANEIGLKDEDGEFQDWIELYNRGSTTVNLSGWSLTDDPENPGQWPLPNVSLAPGQYLVVFASGKDRRASASSLHTNFKLSISGEYIGLFSPELPREVISEITTYPVQRNDHAYTRMSDGKWVYTSRPSPGAANGASTIVGVVAPVHFSVTRGFFDAPFNLHLSTQTRGAVIRYTLDGSEPTATYGTNYTGPLWIDRLTVVRAAAFKENHLPSAAETHTYLLSQTAARRSIPALSISTASSNLLGPTGIMSANPRNTTKHGIAWERQVSAEFIRPEDNGGFQFNAGLRVQGGAYIRGRYNPNAGPPEGKYSFRLYFRGDYGAGKLEYPLLGEDIPVQEFDRIVLRAGMNDHTNPFVVDELIRRLYADTGQVSSRGTFVTFFLNGVYKGYYNPTERIDGKFLQSWHGGGEEWDLIAQSGEVREGNATEWNSMRSFISTRDITQPANYQEAARRLDMENFVDYLLVNAYGATGDWPHNNWRAARERAPGGKFRFYIWDAEWAFGYQNPVTHNTFTAELNGGTEIATLFQRLRRNREFALLFADRIQKHMFNNGALTDTNVAVRFNELRQTMRSLIPTMNTNILRSWIPQRRPNLLRHVNTLGFGAYTNAPAFSKHGGTVSAGFPLSMTSSNAAATIYYTTDGSDPRVAFTEAVSPSAKAYARGSTISLTQDVIIKARTVSSGTNWSALTEAQFLVARSGLPLRITEIMYNPTGGDAYEFIELQNIGTAGVDLSHLSFSGFDFSFLENTQLAAGATIVLSSSVNPAAFASRYPGLTVAGRFEGSLANGGERIALNDQQGNTIVSVDYDDENGWPAGADGGGYSLEIIDPNSDPDNPANWRLSGQLGGNPGVAPVITNTPKSILIHEVMAENAGAVANGADRPDWVELYNPGASAVNLGGWSLSDNDDPRRFVFPASTTIPANGYLIVWFDNQVNSPGLHSGFGLSRSGDNVFLYDNLTNRVDAVSFGLQISDQSIGRVGDSWVLTQPTPGAGNAPAPVGSPRSLVLNEWMANPLSGEADWLEIFNTDKQLPVPLKGLIIGNGSSTHQIGSISFISPGGYLQLFADEEPGVDHLDFKLAASGGTITLSDASASEISRVTFGPQLEGVSEGRVPDGSSTISRFIGTSSPGQANFAVSYAGPRINEFMARNQSLVKDSAGRVADWIEIYNPGSAAAELGGIRLRIGEADANDWTFPPGTSIPAQGYLVVWADSSRPASGASENYLNLGRALSGEGGGIFLYSSSGQLVDSVPYGFQVADQSVGLSQGLWALLSRPTPGAANASAAPLASPSNVRFNEWMPDAFSGDDWIELYNTAQQPISLSGIYLTDDPSIAGKTNFQVGPLTFIPPQGWVIWQASGDQTLGRDHLSFSLSRLGESLRIYGQDLVLIDSVDFGSLEPGVSMGRIPDGASNVAEFKGSATPGANNYLALTDVIINEVLTHSAPPLEDAVELYNPTSQSVNIGGWYLTDNASNLTKYRIPAGTVIPSKGYKVIYEYEFNHTPGAVTSFAFDSSRGDEVILSETDESGNLTHYRSVARFGAAESGVSFGRLMTSVGTDYVPLPSRSFGADHPSSQGEFRTGRGQQNAYPVTGPVVISEIMYHSATVNGADRIENEEDEFVELLNISSNSVPLFDPASSANRWKLGGAVEYLFPENLTLAPQERLLIVSFNPNANSTALSAFRNKFGVPANVRVVGPFQGKLDNAGESIELLKPDRPQAGPADAGFVPYVVADHVSYSDRSPWPVEPDGFGASLQRRFPAQYGNEPINWIGLAPTPGRAAELPVDADQDTDGIPDYWETANGLDAQYPHDAHDDADLDGVTNLQEFMSGTLARNAESHLHLSGITTRALSPALSFVAVAGKSYSIQYRENFAGGQWKTLTNIPAESASRLVEITDPGNPTGAVRFYRIVTPQQP